MTPYDMEKRTFHDVVRLYADVRAMQIREAQKEETRENTKSETIIRRPAGDDWF